MKRISHIKITKHLGALCLVQRVLDIGNGIMISNHEVINLTIITTENHIGRIQDRTGLTKGSQLTQPSMGRRLWRRLARNNDTTGGAQHGLEQMEEFEQNMRRSND